MKDFEIDPNTRDYKLTNGRIVLSDDIRNNIFFSLFVKRGTYMFAKNFGSRLHLLTREKALARLEPLAVEYCREAVQWIIDTGRSGKIKITAELDSENTRMLCLLESYQNGNKIVFEHFIKVR